jgi:ADP-ribose pyrophosphatase YjhB (NUDIX family)
MDDRKRHVCTACGFVLYMNPKIAAGTVPVGPDGRLALIRRGVEPGLGRWSWPCGYVEMDEDVPSCARRETREETGLDVELGDLLALYSYPARDDPDGGDVSSTGIVLVCYRATVTGGVMTAGDDALEARWFAPEDIPWDDLAFDSSHRGLRDFLGG